VKIESQVSGDFMNALELKIPPMVLAAMLSAIMWFLARVAPVLAFSFPGQGLLIVVLATAGGLIGVAGVVAFHRSRTTVDPRNPLATSALVTTGAYRLTRNPMYVGAFLALAAWATHIGNVLAFAGLPAFVAYLNRFQIAPEERALRARFGSSFCDYQRSVRRWL
jgi:protein-S-isoprenylcysteine O-methyltransferase Ste14